MAKLDIVQVGRVQEYADRSIDIQAVDTVRGDVVLRLTESEARWLFASLADVINPWKVEDGD